MVQSRGSIPTSADLSAAYCLSSIASMDRRTSLPPFSSFGGASGPSSTVSGSAQGAARRTAGAPPPSPGGRTSDRFSRDPAGLRPGASDLSRYSLNNPTASPLQPPTAAAAAATTPARTVGASYAPASRRPHDEYAPMQGVEPGPRASQRLAFTEGGTGSEALARQPRAPPPVSYPLGMRPSQRAPSPGPPSGSRTTLMGPPPPPDARFQTLSGRAPLLDHGAAPRAVPLLRPTGAAGPASGSGSSPTSTGQPGQWVCNEPGCGKVFTRASSPLLRASGPF